MSIAAMNIALDATPLSEPTGGVARYTWELARSLAEAFPDDQYWLLSDQPFATPLNCPRNLHSGSRPDPSNLADLMDRRWWLWGLQREMERRHVSLFHGTDFSVPYVPMGRPSVMTIHDLSPWSTEPWNHATNRVRWRTPQLLRLGLVRKVITPSHAVRREAIEQFQLPPEDVVAVPLAAREFFQPAPATREDSPYFLFVGTLEERKNVTRLIEAWREVRQRHAIELWMVGRVRGGYTPPAQSDGLRYLGAVDDSDLPALYSGALAFVYPSFYEGFGLPVLEAMQCGCPVIASNDPAILEVSESAAIHVDAHDTAALVSAMITAIEDPAMRERFRGAGLLRAACFSWRETAQRTREVYESAGAH